MRQTRSHRKNKISPSGFTFAEVLEYRRLLSAIPNPVAYPDDSAVPQGGGIPAGQASPPGYSPTQIKSAYGISNISFNGTAGTGAGQTIAIVAAYDNPNFVDSTDPNFDNSDLHKFDVAMGLPDPPSFIKVDENGGTNYPTADYGWANEIALDVEWTHAIAPSANILLVESSSTNLFGLIEGAGNYARNAPGVSVVTMSFAVSEFFGENQYDPYLTTPSGHEGVTFVAASGDNGDPGGYPGFSPNVVSVGATALTLSGDTYVSETGHNTSGGGISVYESKPSYQYTVKQSATFRTTPDVSFDGDPNTGVSVYDSYNGGSATPWYKIGGTSFSSPAWAALIAIADQGRASLDLGTLDGPSQTLPRLYELGSSDYHDVTTGSTDGTTVVSAGVGYDLVTGIGTPIANLLVPDLAGGNTVAGTIFNDENGNGQLDAGEPGLSGFSTFVDLYNTGTVVGSDPEVTSGSDGTYTFSDLPGGTYHFIQRTPAGWDLTTSSAGYTLTLGFDTDDTGKNIGYQTNNEPAELAFGQQPTAVVVTNDITPAITVAVENSDGNIITTDNSQVTLSITGGSATLDGTLTEKAVAGIATFSDISIDTTGTYTLSATDGNLAGATSNSFSVNNAPPAVSAQLAFGQQPISAAAGSPISPAVSVYLEDASGHIVSTDESLVTIALANGATANAPTGTLSVNAVNGIATFSNIVFTSTGTAALTATDGTLTPATSNNFPVVIVPAKVVFAQQPSAATVGKPIAPPITVDVEDAAGNLDTGDTSAVTLSLATGPGTLDGTLTVDAVGGVATFSDVTVSGAGTFSLTARDGILAADASGSFTATVPGTIVPTAVRSTLTGSLISGTKIRAAVTVDETSQTGATGTVTTNVYAVSSDGTLTLLGSVSKRMALKKGKPAAISVPITTTPASLSGTYTLEAQVLDLAGNPSVVAVPGTVKLAAPFIALSESFAKLTLPVAVVAGSPIKAAAVLKISNAGNIASTGPTTIGIYASPDGLIADATLIASVTRKLSIKANGSASVTIPIGAIPASLNGNYKIVAQVTDPEANVTTASSGKTVDIAQPFISLSATVSTPKPVSLLPGKTTSVELTVKNTGNIASNSSATISIGLTSDGTTELPGSATIARFVNIPAGKSVTLRLPLTIPTTITAGIYSPFVSFSQGSIEVTGVGAATVTVT